MSPLEVRRIIQVADEDVMGSLTAVCRLDREVHELSTTHPSGDPIEQMESVVQMYEEEMLEWERTTTVRRDSDADPDPVQEPTGQKMVEVLEKILAEDEAAKDPPLRLEDTAWTRQVLRQATKVLCLAGPLPRSGGSRVPTASTDGGWSRRSDTSTPALEVRTRRRPPKAKTWLMKVHESVKRARELIGSHLHKGAETVKIQRHVVVPDFELQHFCRHDGPPEESPPCDTQAFTAIQRACRAWEANAERLRSVCGEVFEAADRSTWDRALAMKSNSSPVWTPAAASEFPPDLISSGEDSDSSETDTEDSDSYATDTESSDSSTTNTEDSDSFVADARDAYPSSTDTGEATLPSAPPMEEDDAELEEMIAGLRGRALQQVRRYVAVLARMRRDLTPCARIHMIKELG